MTEFQLYFYDYYLFVERWAYVIVSAIILACIYLWLL